MYIHKDICFSDILFNLNKNKNRKKDGKTLGRINEICLIFPLRISTLFGKSK